MRCRRLEERFVQKLQEQGSGHLWLALDRGLYCLVILLDLAVKRNMISGSCWRAECVQHLCEHREIRVQVGM
jgi:hypothetical protein